MSAGSTPPADDRVPDQDGTSPADGAGPEESKRPDERRRSGRNREIPEDVDRVSMVDREKTRTAIHELRGDVVGGDKVVINVAGHHGATVRAHRVTEESIGHPYVASTGFAQVEDAIRQRRIVVVRGPAGSGKAAALLRAFTGGNTTAVVLRLDPRTDLRSLAPEKFTDCQAVILEDLSEKHLDQLGEFEIGRLQSELADLWLGLTISDKFGIPPALHGIVVNIGDPPSTQDVFEQHFSSTQPVQEIRDELLATPGVRDEIHTALGESARLGDAAGLAGYLGSYLAASPELVSDLRSWRISGADAVRQQWFRKLPDLRTHCTAVSLAVLNGLPREEVTAQAHALAERIAPTPEDSHDNIPNPFASDTDIVAALRAETRRETVPFTEGDITQTIMRYADLSYPSWVLRNVWDTVDSARPAVGEWLKDLGEHSSPAVRNRAAAAVGVLAERAFQPILAEIIEPWMADGRSRRNAAIALSVPAGHEPLATTVGELVKRWTRQEANPGHRATAALVLGETTETATLAESLDRLGDLADDRDDAVTTAVATALATMFCSDRGAMAGHVLFTVGDWMQQRRSSQRQLTGRCTFLFLAVLRGDPSASSRSDPHQTVPTLLVAAQRSGSFAGKLSSMLHNAFNSEWHRAFGKELTGWARAVEERPDLFPIFAWLLHGPAATDRRTATTIRRLAGAWITDQTAPRTAEALLAQLTGVIPDDQ